MRTNDNGPELLAQVKVVVIAKTTRGLGLSTTGRATDIAWLPRSQVLAVSYPEPDFPEIANVTLPHWLAVKSKLSPPQPVRGWG